MTVIFSKKCELGLQAVLFLSTQQNDQLFNASQISKSLKVPKEFVSKVLQALTDSDIVASKKGKKGGFQLAKSPSDIKLIEIVKAIDGLAIFNSCVLGFPGCSSLEPCPMHEKWGKLREEGYKMLSTESLEELKEKTISKLTKI